MQKLAIIILFLGYSLIVLSQDSNSKQSFYIGLSSVSTFTTSKINVDDVVYVDTISFNPLDFGVYCGNEFSIGDKFILDLEFFYLNNKVEISREQNKRFELHQNIGCLLKPEYDYYYNLEVTLQFEWESAKIPCTLLSLGYALRYFSLGNITFTYCFAHRSACSKRNN